MAANSSSEIKAADIIPYCDDELKPFVGRTYESIKEFEESYKNYAHTVGFSVRSWTATKDKNHVLKYKYFVCSKEGFNKKKQHMQSEDKGKKISRKRSNTREGCNATACVRRTEEGNYMVITFIEGHSHELCTPRKKQFLRSNRKICDAQKNLLSSLDRVNIGVSKAYHFIKDQVGGYENVGFTIKDAQNYSRDLKTLIKDTDAHMFIDSLKRQQESDPSFYFVYELDVDDHLKHVFWADGIARKNYAVFGDLISFDSTYNTNKY